jgi:hypothetical protein
MIRASFRAITHPRKKFALALLTRRKDKTSQPFLQNALIVTILARPSGINLRNFTGRRNRANAKSIPMRFRKLRCEPLVKLEKRPHIVKKVAITRLDFARFVDRDLNARAVVIGRQTYISGRARAHGFVSGRKYWERLRECHLEINSVR